MPLPPGTILQQLYLRERLARLKRGMFIEIGPGEGYLSALLLGAGWRGVGIEPDEVSAERARALNREAVADGRYDLLHDDWLHPAHPERMPTNVDLILSCMVLEHLDDSDELAYFRRCEAQLGKDGIGILLVPASERAWGIEDVAAGHYRRYTRQRLRRLFRVAGWRLQHLAGLTYPISNVLLPLSNWLVRREESDKSEMTMHERTLSSGRRHVPGKTVFPAAAGLILNPIAMYPLHLLQKVFRSSASALVLYAEGRPPRREGS